MATPVHPLIRIGIRHPSPDLVLSTHPLGHDPRQFATVLKVPFLRTSQPFHHSMHLLTGPEGDPNEEVGKAGGALGTHRRRLLRRCHGRAMLARGRSDPVKTSVNFRQGNPLTIPFQLTTLGRLSLSRDRTEFMAVRRKPLCLLAYLVRQPGARASRDELADRFWPRAGEGRGRASLRQALSELREILGPALGASDREVWVKPGSVEVDAARCEALYLAGDMAGAAAAWGGDFLAGFESLLEEDLRGWLEGERTRLRRVRARAGAALVAEAEARGDWTHALAQARAWHRALPDDDEASRRIDTLERMAVDSRGPALAGGLGLLTPDLVAREDDFAALTAGWDEVERGRPGLILVEGEAGTGKSRLLEEWLRWFRRRHPDAIVLSARAFEAEREREHMLARHMFGSLAGAPGVVGSPASALRGLQRILPEFGERFAELPAGPTDEESEALARVLTAAAGERPIVLAVDDVHLADSPSLALVHHLLRHPIAGVLLVLTAGPGDLDVTEVARRGAEATPLQRIHLRPLTRTELEELLTGMGAFRPADRAALAEWLWGESGGNPQAAVELTSALADAGRLALDPTGHWRVTLPSPGEPLPLTPGRSATSNPAREQLDADERLVLDAVAVLGRDASLANVLAMAADNAPRLEAAVDRLVHRRLLRPAMAQPDVLEFPHQRIQGRVYRRLPHGRRRWLHRQAVAVLSGSARTHPATAEAVAHHRSIAAGPGIRSGRLVAAALALLAIVLGIRAVRARPGAPWRTAIGAFESGPERRLGAVFPALMALALEDGPGLELVGEADAAAASHEVTGLVEQQGDRVRVTAELRDRHSHRVIRQARAVGTLEELGTVASTLANQLARRGARPGRNAFLLEAARTRSLEALESYLAGQRLSAQLDMQGAAISFWQATRSDPTFAAAWHGLSRANAWFWLNDRSARMADSAVAHSRSLSPRDARVVSAWRALAHGDAEAAEREFRAVLAFAPAFEEAQVGLAETLHHFTWTQGRSRLEAGPAWDAAARLDPLDWRPVLHRFEVAVTRGDVALAERILSQPSPVTSDTLGTRDERLILAARRRDSVEFRSRLAQFSDASDWSLAALAGSLVVLADNPSASEEVARLLTAPSRSRELRAMGHELLAQLALARGRWRTALLEADRAALLEPVSATTLLAVLRAAPFLPSACRSDSAQGVLASALRGVPPDPPTRTLNFWYDYDRARARLLYPYFARLLATQRGEQAAGAGFASELRADSLTSLAPGLSASLDAWRAARGGDTAAAIAALDGAWRGVDLSAMLFSPASVRPWDLFLKARGLAASGDLESAVGWYGSLGVNGLADYAYAAPAALERARLLERLGHHDAAAADYRRVVVLWSDADPEFGPLLDEARRGLERVR